MMKIPVLFVLSVLPVLHAEEGKVEAPATAPAEAPVAAPAPAAIPAAKEEKLSAEELRKKLMATVKEELEAFNKTAGDHLGVLENYLKELDLRSPEEASDVSFLQSALPVDPGFEKSRELYKAYTAQLTKESRENRIKYEENCTKTVTDLVKRAVASQDPEKLSQMGEELDEFYRKMAQARRQPDEQGNYRISELSQDQSSIRSFISLVGRFHSQRVEEQWGSAASNLQELRRQAIKLNRYLPVNESMAFIASCERSIGLLPLDETLQLFDATVGDLLDDKNQDRLDAIQGTIRKQVELCRSSSKSAFSQKWQNLSELASSFSQNVSRMKQGSPPQFSPEQWVRSNPDALVTIGRERLVEAMKRYRVKVKDSTGEVREEPIYYDMNEVIARIQSPADIAREMPVFQKASKQSSYSSDNGNWQTLGQRLQQYGELFAKLESGASFAIGAYGQSEYGYERSSNPVVEDAASKKAAELNQQLQWMIVQRFLPDVQADAKTTPAKAVADRFAQAKKGGDYQAMLTLGRLSAYLAPGQGLLTPQDGLAIQWYLDGVKQEEQLGQPRLATYYFQRSAAVPNSPIPPHVFKARLKNLKYSAPKDYDKGTDDALGRNLDSTGMGMQAPLMVPEKVTAEKVPSEK